MRTCLTLALLGLSMMWTVQAHAAEVWHGQRPPGDAPTEVAASLYVVDVFGIDSVEQNVHADVIYRVRWQDPRLAKPGSGRRRMPVSQVWSPTIQSLNPQLVRSSFPEEVTVEEDGMVTYRQRLVGRFSLSLNLAEFPFDEHDLHFRFFSSSNGVDEVKFVEGDVVGRAETLSIPDWEFGTGRLSVEPLRVSPAVPMVPAFGYSVRVTRRSSYYIWKVILPVVMIVFMSWAVFWIHPSHVRSQIGLAATSILTIIAYRFALTNDLPKVSYTTRMDLFTNGAFVLVFLALVEVVVATHLYTQEDTRLGEKIDRISRVVFPAVFVGIMGYAFWL